MDILEEIVAHKRQEIEERQQYINPRYLYSLVQGKLSEPVPSMSKALMKSGTGIIAEFKRKSPSKGWINPESKPEQVTLLYQQNGAAALSILTDTKYFGGYDEYIQQARLAGVTLPILYKNFVIDPYQLLQARYCGASAVLLIAACLSKEECAQLLSMAHDLGLEVLLEMHSERDLEYADLKPDMYGINNRNLGTFTTDVNNSFRFAAQLPADGCKVSESGIHNADTLRALRKAGFNGFLMGEYFMKHSNPGEPLKNLIEELQNN